MRGQLPLRTLIDRCPISPPATPLCSALVCFAVLGSLLVRVCVCTDVVHLGAQKVSVGARMWPDVCM
jgi:hypothetical protein